MFARQSSTANASRASLRWMPAAPSSTPRLPDPAPVRAVVPQAVATATAGWGARRHDGLNALGVAVSTRVMSLVGDAAAGVFLSQLLYWSRRTPGLAERDGWIFKTAAELSRETGMSWKAQRRARQILLNGRWIEERKLMMPARLEYRLHLPALAEALGQGSDMQSGPFLDWAVLANRADPTLERLLGRSFLFHGVLTQVMPLTAAILASRLETRPQNESDAERELPYWWRLQRDAWKAETGLSRDQWQTARKHLARLGILVERGHNFPRRVDLALDPRRTKALIAECRAMAAAQARAEFEQEAARMSADAGPHAGQPEAGREREKQAGGFGRYPNPPSTVSGALPVSPDPACTDRPILPVAIDQSCLYPNTPLPSTTHHTYREPAQAVAGFGTVAWGGSGWMVQTVLKVKYGDGLTGHKPVELHASRKAGSGETAPSVRPHQVERSTAAIPPGMTALTAEATLHWPRALKRVPEELGLAMRQLAGLDAETQQTVLDEIDFIDRYTDRQVRNPLGLLRTLCGKARDGKFTPEGAHRIAADRAERQRNAAQAAPSPATSPTLQAEKTSPPVLSESAVEARKRLAQLTSDLKRRSFG